MGKGLGHEKKKHFVRYHYYYYNFKKTLTDDKLTTCSYT